MLSDGDLGKVRGRHEVDVPGIDGPVKQALTESEFLVTARTF
jgi:hypothetical protein